MLRVRTASEDARGRDPAVVIDPTQRPGRSGAWKSEPAIGTRRQPVRPGAEASAPLGRDAGTGDLQRGEAAVDQDPQRRFPEIIGGMGETGNPTRTPDQGDRLGPGEARLGDLGESAVAEVAGERIAVAGDLLRPHQPVGQVAAAESGAGKGLAERHQVDLEAQRGESVGHRAKSIGAGVREARRVAARSAGSSSRTKWPRMWISRPRSSTAVSSTPPISSTPRRAASGRATAIAERVSWSVIASAVRPTQPAAITTSQGEQTPSECVVWTWRSAALGRAGRREVEGVRDGFGTLRSEARRGS